MYINFWYPIAKSEDVVTYEPHRAQVLGQQLVAFRDTERRAHVLSDVCIHRGAALGKGWVKGRYRRVPVSRLAVRRRRLVHSIFRPWTTSRCRPAPRSTVTRYRKNTASCSPSSATCRKSRTATASRDRGIRPGRLARNKLVVFELNAFYERSIENGLDPSHNEFVHPAQGLPGMQSRFSEKTAGHARRPVGE